MRIARIVSIVAAGALLAAVNLAQQQEPPSGQKPPEMNQWGGGMMGIPGQPGMQPGRPGMPPMGQGQPGMQPGMPGMMPPMPQMPQGPRPMQMMMEMQTMDDRLRDKLNAMNGEIGERKIEAMAATINELAEQNRRMRQMILELSRQPQPMAGWPPQPGMNPGIPAMPPGWGMEPPPGMMGPATTTTLFK